MMRSTTVAILVALVATVCVPRFFPPEESRFRVVRHSPKLDKLIPTYASVEILGRGFKWLEGPFFTQNRLLFSDTILNCMFSWTPAEGISVFLQPIYGPGLTEGKIEPGSNGIAVVHDRLMFAAHGDRWISCVNLTLLDFQTPAEQLERKWAWPGNVINLVAKEFEGKRLNSPNDLATSRAGPIYFTDPPYGLQDIDYNEGKGNLDQHPAKELPFNGVFMVKRPHTLSASISVFEKELTRPNGIGLSPDEKLLYVANSDAKRPVIMVYDIDETTRIPTNGRLFFDFATQLGPGVPDGFDVDSDGNIYSSGPGGVYIISATGELLGKIDLKKMVSNCALGGGFLYITAQDTLLRIPVAELWSFEK